MYFLRLFQVVDSTVKELTDDVFMRKDLISICGQHKCGFSHSFITVISLCCYGWGLASPTLGNDNETTPIHTERLL